RARVHEFLIKPIDMKQLTACLTPLLEETPASGRGARKPAGGRFEGFGPLVGKSPVMRSLYDSIEKVGPSDANVLLIGDSGTGKELVARAIHDVSPRAEKPFLAVNCGAVPNDLIGSELFGHERGSFTGATRQHRGFFERANGGTLFLDEITEMPAELQVNFLRVIETGTFRHIGGDRDLETDVRIVAATNQNPEEAVSDGKLREDLYFRLTVFPIRLPLLRERPGDIELLAGYFLDEFNEAQGKSARLTREAVRALERHTWPGNVRELRNVVQRAFILADGEIGEPEIDEAIRLGGEFSSGTPQIAVGLTIGEAERQLIFSTLEHYEGNKRATAEALGISLKTLYNRLKEYEQTAEAEGESRRSG
ncbi:MAG: sigma-54 dependent transcriptional regulator, partial [Gammaproteobacteria bacterium]|nr:sigma-54 dependent transcriptional regulator [Gammaproteobacteria bacterium]